MNQALEVEGAMFIDASVYVRRQMIGPADDRQSNPNLTNIEAESEKPRHEERPKSRGAKSMMMNQKVQF